MSSLLTLYLVKHKLIYIHSSVTTARTLNVHVMPHRDLSSVTNMIEVHCSTHPVIPYFSSKERLVLINGSDLANPKIQSNISKTFSWGDH